MSLWDLLRLTAFGVGFSGVYIAQHEHAGALGWTIGLGVGGALGYATFRLDRLARSYMDRLLADHDGSGKEGRFRLVYGLAMLWVVSAGAIADSVILLSLRLLRP